MTAPKAPSVRFPVDPGDIPADKVARRLHLTPAEFRGHLPALLRRGFPPADHDTGMFDLEAVDRWRHLRHARFFPELTPAGAVKDSEAQGSSMGERFHAARERQLAERGGTRGQRRRRTVSGGQDDGCLTGPL